MRAFLEEMAGLGAQGYLRPFTVDEEQSIGVTFPNQPSIHAMASLYDQYLGEPFCGVVIPHMVRALGVNKTGWLKLGINYLMSVKAIDEAKRIRARRGRRPLPRRPDREPDQDREVHRVGFVLLPVRPQGRDGVVKIPESPLILPSVTIQGHGDHSYAAWASRSRSAPSHTASSSAASRPASSWPPPASERPGSSIDARSSSWSTTTPRSSRPTSRRETPPLRRAPQGEGILLDIYREKVSPPEGLTLYRYACDGLNGRRSGRTI